MNVIKKRSDIIENLVIFEGLLNSKKQEEKDYALNLVLNDPQIVIYKVLGENHFGPASFLGIKKANMEEQKTLDEAGLKEIKKAINDVVGTAFTNDTTVSKYKEYAVTLSNKIPNIGRSFWRVKDERGKNLNLTEKDLSGK